MRLRRVSICRLVLGYKKLCLDFDSFLQACTLILLLNSARSRIRGLVTRVIKSPIFAEHHSTEELRRLVFCKRKWGLSAQQV